MDAVLVPPLIIAIAVVTIRTLGSKEVTMQNACENELKTTTQAIHVFSVFLRLIRFNIRNRSV